MAPVEPGDARAGDVLRVAAVLFDAVGTLIRPRPSVAEAYAAAAQRWDLQVDPATVLARFRRAFDAEEDIDRLAGDGATSELRERRRWQSIVAAVFPDAADPTALFAQLWDHFARPEHWVLDPDVAPLFARLRAAGLIVGVASNFDERLLALVRAWPATAEVPVFVSSQLGKRKPHRGFYASIAQQLALPAQRLLMVGDDWENDVQGAQAAGWRAVYLRRPDRGAAAVYQPSQTTERCVTSLAALADLLACT
ncbi:MAG: HAD family hydrolase [Pirellulales bacterium]|nr:HAD family hydrolase [Pirellulales bacterium]